MRQCGRAYGRWRGTYQGTALVLARDGRTYVYECDTYKCMTLLKKKSDDHDFFRLFGLQLHQDIAHSASLLLCIVLHPIMAVCPVLESLHTIKAHVRRSIRSCRFRLMGFIVSTMFGLSSHTEWNECLCFFTVLYVGNRPDKLLRHECWMATGSPSATRALC